MTDKTLSQLTAITAGDTGDSVYLVQGGNSRRSQFGKVLGARTLTAGAGLTGGGDLSDNRSFAVGQGTGIAVNADDVALNVNGLTEDTSPDAAADYLATYDASATTHKKVLLSRVGVTDASFVTLGTHSGLSAERVLTPGTGITGTDAGANSTYTVALDTTHARNALHPASSTDNAIARYDSTAGALQNSGVLIDDSNRVTDAAQYRVGSTDPSKIMLGGSAITETVPTILAVEGSSGAPRTDGTYKTPTLYLERHTNGANADSCDWGNTKKNAVILVEAVAYAAETGEINGLASRVYSASAKASGAQPLVGLSAIAQSNAGLGNDNRDCFGANLVVSFPTGNSPDNLVGIEVDIIPTTSSSTTRPGQASADNFTGFWAQSAGAAGIIANTAFYASKLSGSGGWQYGLVIDTSVVTQLAYLKTDTDAATAKGLRLEVKYDTDNTGRAVEVFADTTELFRINTSTSNPVLALIDSALINLIGGSVGTTDNRMVRTDGAGGHTLQSTGITISDAESISGVNVLTATSVIVTSSADTSFRVISTGSGTPDWLHQTVVTVGTAGRYRIFDLAGTGGEMLTLYQSDGITLFGAAAPGANAFVVAGSVLSNHATKGIGYTTGAGGTVTQLTSKATGVTLSKVCGTITLHNAALAANTNVSFTWTNTALAAGDVIVWQHISGGTIGAYEVNANPGAGSAAVTVRNTTGGSLSEAPVFAFFVLKAGTA